MIYLQYYKMRKQYFILELKNCIAIIKKNLLTMLVVVLILAAAFTAVNFLITQKTGNTPIHCAVVINEDDDMTRMIMRYISHEKSIEAISDFTYCDNESAFSMLESNEVNAVIDFGEDFFNDVNNGQNTPLKVYIREDSDYLTVLFAGMLYSAQGYVQNTEATVYSFLTTVRDEDGIPKDPKLHIGDYIALKYGQLILHRSNIYEDRIISPIGTIDKYEYLFTCFIIIFILYCISMFDDMYDDSASSFGKVLRVYGIGAAALSFIRESVMLVAVTILSGLLVLIKSITYSLLEREVPVNPAVYPGIFISILAVVSLYNMLMNLIGRKPIGKLLIVCIFAFMAISSGIIIPYAFMPSFLIVAGKINPLYYTNNIICNRNVAISLAITFILIVIENLVVIKCEKQ